LISYHTIQAVEYMLWKIEQEARYQYSRELIVKLLWSRWHFALSLSAIGLAGVAGYVGLVQLSGAAEDLGATAAVLAGIMTATLLYLDPSEKMANAQIAANQAEALELETRHVRSIDLRAAERASLMGDVTPATYEVTRIALSRIVDRWDKARGGSPHAYSEDAIAAVVAALQSKAKESSGFTDSAGSGGSPDQW
jgi:hypothetical protein